MIRRLLRALVRWRCETFGHDAILAPQHMAPGGRAFGRIVCARCEKVVAVGRL